MATRKSKKQYHKEKHECPKCGKVIKTKGGLTMHKRFCSGETPDDTKTTLPTGEGDLTLAQLKVLVETTGGGVKTKQFDKVVSDLKNGFMRDFTIEETCRYAGISHDTYYRWCKQSEEFKGEMETAQDYIFKKAKQTILDSIDKGSAGDAKWLLERRQRDRYATKVHEEQSGEVNYNLTNFTREELKGKSTEELQKIANDQLMNDE